MALRLGSIMSKVSLNIFQTIIMMVGMMIDIGPKLNSAIPPAFASDLKVKVMELMC